MRSFLSRALLFLMLVAGLVHADDAVAPDPALEKRVMALSEELRCLVCQNQTLADSHAELAVDLRNQVREKLAAGMSEREVVDFLVERYGDFVLYRPPFKASTWLLWIGPFVLLLGGLAALLVRLARRPGDIQDDAAGPSAAELQRAASLLEDDEARRRGEKT